VASSASRAIASRALRDSGIRSRSFNRDDHETLDEHERGESPISSSFSCRAHKRSSGNGQTQPEKMCARMRNRGDSAAWAERTLVIMSIALSGRSSYERKTFEFVCRALVAPGRLRITGLSVCQRDDWSDFRPDPRQVSADARWTGQHQS
jgi:hypothetical protein